MADSATTNTNSTRDADPNPRSTAHSTATTASATSRRSAKLVKLLVVSVATAGLILGVQWWLDRPLAEVRRQLDQGQADKALKLVNFYLLGHPEQPRALALKARALSSLGDSIEAIRLFEQVGVANAAEMHAMARAYLKQAMWSRAQALLVQVVQIEPRNREALDDLAVCQFQLGAINSALQTADKITQLEGGAARGYAWQAFLLQKTDRTQEAIEAFKKCLEAAPDAVGLPTPPGEFYVQYARALSDAERWDEAQKAAERSLTVGPNADACVIFAEVFTKLGQTDDALTYWQKAVTLNPTLLPAREALADAAIRNGDIKAAQQWLQPLAMSGMMRSQTADLFAQAASFMKDEASAKKWREQADELRAQEKVQQALERLLKRAPDSLWAQLVRAHQFASTGNWTEAQSILAPVAVEVPDDPLVQDMIEAIKQQGPLPSLERMPLDKF